VHTKKAYVGWKYSSTHSLPQLKMDDLQKELCISGFPGGPHKQCHMILLLLVNQQMAHKVCDIPSNVQILQRERHPITGLEKPLGLQEVEVPRISIQSSTLQIGGLYPPKRYP